MKFLPVNKELLTLPMVAFTQSSYLYAFNVPASIDSELVTLANLAFPVVAVVILTCLKLALSSTTLLPAVKDGALVMLVDNDVAVS